MHPIEELAALRHPLPQPDSVTPEDGYADACEQMGEQCEEEALRLEAASDGLEADPLLLALEDLKAQKEAVDALIRQLLAYGREFHGTRPYGLEELARRAGYSISRSSHRLRRDGDQAGRRADRPGAEPAAP